MIKQVVIALQQLFLASQEDGPEISMGQNVWHANVMCTLGRSGLRVRKGCIVFAVRRVTKDGSPSSTKACSALAFGAPA